MTTTLKVVLPTRYISIEEECKRNPELKMSDLQMLKDWMDKQPHLPNIEIIYFVTFLHSNYYNIEATKRTIENFFTVRTHFPEVFSNRDPIAWKGLRKAFNVVACVPLKQRTKENYAMTFGKFLDPNPSQFDQNECSKYLFMTCEIQHVIEGTSNGLVIIVDSAQLSLGHLARFNLMMLKKFIYYVQEAAPVRLKALHVLNTIPTAMTLLNLTKPFIKMELIQLIHLHSSMETVKQFLPVEALPSEYEGGKAGPVEKLNDENVKVMEEFREWLQYDEIIGRVDESLRVGKCQAKDDLFGMDGSFKKLDID